MNSNDVTLGIARALEAELADSLVIDVQEPNPLFGTTVGLYLSARSKNHSLDLELSRSAHEWIVHVGSVLRLELPASEETDELVTALTWALALQGCGLYSIAGETYLIAGNHELTAQEVSTRYDGEQPTRIEEWDSWISGSGKSSAAPAPVNTALAFNLSSP